MKNKLLLMAILVVESMAAVSARAQDAAPPSADEAAIRAGAQKFVDAYNRRDSQTMASMWSPEAVYMDPATGESVVGRDAIAKQFDDAFAEAADAKLAVTVGSIEFVSPNVAIEKGTALVTYSDGEPEESEYTAVMVKRDGKWQLDRVSESVKEEPPPSNYEHLKELEWMIGSWIDAGESPGVTVQTDCEWTKNRNFITRSFAVAIGDQVDMAGMQIIGWDAAEKQIRSWLFDSDGSFAEGTWTHKGNEWLIRAVGTLPDGRKTSAVNILKYVDDDSCTWQSTNREVGDEILPNVEEVLLVRKPTE